MARVLVIDDDPSLLRALRVSLRAGGHEVVTAANGEQGIAQAARSSPEVIILDLGLPDVDGLNVCRQIRQWSEVPIIFLSASGSEDRKVAALNSGANDYVTKPFGMAELEARIRASSRVHRADAAEQMPTELSIGTLDLDLVHHQVHLDGELVKLTSKEFEVLSFLARHVGRTCTHQMILNAVWGPGYGQESPYVRTYIHRLRIKLRDESAQLIETTPGIGYRLTAA
jgi:two-component system KDP operon response regulator KdpE